MDELPELTLEEVREKMLKAFNEGDFKKGVGVWLYYKLGQDDFVDKIDEAIMKAAREVIQRSKDQDEEKA